MGEIHNIGKFLVILGIVITLLGLIISLIPKIPFLGKLPGDLYVKRENFSFYFPLATCILISLLLTLILNLIFKK